MILVISHSRDAHLPRVTNRLSEAGATWALLDTDAYPTQMRLVDDPSGCVLYTATQRLDLNDVTAVWWRRPRPPQIAERSDEFAGWAQRQAFAAMDSAVRAIDAVWVNHPGRNYLAEDKPANLRRAAALGLDVPDWCVTNDPIVARAFAARHAAIVVKAVESAYVAAGRALWTRRIDDHSWLDRLGPEPYMLQRFIDKTHDVRVTIVGDDHFAVAIDSQATVDTSVDMRAGRLGDLPHREIKLPDEVSSHIHDLAAELGLRFAAIDLIADADGQYWFLELNPNGQWAWLEERAHVPIAEALTALLT